jgi:hypothetical protein
MERSIGKPVNLGAEGDADAEHAVAHGWRGQPRDWHRIAGDEGRPDLVADRHHRGMRRWPLRLGAVEL